MEKENRRGGQEEIWKGKQEKAKQEKEKTNKEEIKERWQQVYSVKKISGVEFYSFNFLQIGITFCQNS